jgi:hypothetical protein
MNRNDPKKTKSSMTVYPKPEIQLKDTITLLSGKALFKDMIIEMTAI